ncbi:MAG: hypothetical protein Q9221_008277 [Calogaya cf. arnoldii]
MKYASIISFLVLSNFLIALGHVITLRETSSNASPNYTVAITPRNLTVNHGPLGPPHGFKIDFSIYRDRPLSPLGVYLNAVKLMYTLSQWTQTIYSWDAQIGVIDLEAALDGYDIKISIQAKDRSLRPTSLQFGEVVWALLSGIRAISEQSLYCMLSIDILKDGNSVGVIFIAPKKRSGPVLPASRLPNSEGIDIATEAPVVSPGISEHIIDPQYRDFVINVQTEGKAIGARYIFLMTLEGLAEAAQYNGEFECRSLHAFNEGANAVFFIGGQGRLLWSHVARTLYLLFGEMVLDKKRFHVMEFQVLKSGTIIGRGSIDDLSVRKGSGGGGTAVA